jgi:hypothetical protein
MIWVLIYSIIHYNQIPLDINNLNYNPKYCLKRVEEKQIVEFDPVTGNQIVGKKRKESTPVEI